MNRKDPPPVPVFVRYIETFDPAPVRVDPFWIVTAPVNVSPALFAGVKPKAVVTLLLLISPRMVADDLFSTLPRPKFVRAVDALAKSDRLFVCSNTPAPETYAAAHALPVYTRISPAVLLKYSAPATSALPSLSSVGFEVLLPR
jgi:hypothetical protein